LAAVYESDEPAATVIFEKLDLGCSFHWLVFPKGSNGLRAQLPAFVLSRSYPTWSVSMARIAAVGPQWQTMFPKWPRHCPLALEWQALVRRPRAWQPSSSS
jgi:hypothetical protein